MIDPLSAREMAADGYYEDWSIMDLLAHLGCWMAEADTVLERIRLDASGVERPFHRHDLADEWFRESGEEHYAEHLPRLGKWVSWPSALRPW